MKEFVKEGLKDISSIGDYLESQIEKLPDQYRQKLRAKIDHLLNLLPGGIRPHPSITIGIERGLPPKEYIQMWVANVRLLIEGNSWNSPAAKRVEERLDEILKL